MNDRTEGLAAHHDFWRHLARQGSWAALLVTVSLLGGTLGFHVFSRQLWVDALLNASMLLGGMGPVGDLGPNAGKLFAAGYALYAGLMFLVIAGLLVTPVFHRVLHRFHVEGK
ncbi:MAG: hypothetical protein ACJ8DV_16415 [Microvirga sp.]